MAAPPSSLFSRHGGSKKRRIDGCLVDASDEDMQQLPSITPELLQPVSLQITYDNSSVLSFRLRVSVVLQDNPEVTAIFLDIPTDEVISLSLNQRPRLPEWLTSKIQPSQARLRLVLADSAGVLVAPSAAKALNPETPSDAQVLTAMRLLSRSHAVVIYLPPGDDLWDHLSTTQISVFPGVTTSSERPLRVAGNPTRLDLKTLYRGKGGRVIPLSETFGHPVVRNTSRGNGTDGDDETSPQSVVELPPSYNEAVPLGAPEPSFPARKRPRMSPSNDYLQAQRAEISDDKKRNLDDLREIWGQAGAINPRDSTQERADIIGVP